MTTPWEPICYSVDTDTMAIEIRPWPGSDDSKVHRLTWVKPLDPSRGTIQLFFDDGSGPVVDLSLVLAQRGVFEAVRDPMVFNTAQVTSDGRSLLWQVGGNVVDLGADALWLMAHPEPTSPPGGYDAGPDLVIHDAPDGQPWLWEIEHASQHPEHIAAALAMLRRAFSAATAE